MRHLHTAELRDSWTTWLSVSLTFIAVNAMALRRPRAMARLLGFGPITTIRSLAAAREYIRECARIAAL